MPTRVLLALAQMADSEAALRPKFRALAEGIAPAATSVLQAAGAETSPAAITLLQTTATGLAVVALATGQTDRAPLIRLLTQLLTTLPQPRKGRQ